MIKILDLGCECPKTFEPRVTLLDDVLTKIASSDIQHFWDTFERKVGKGYLHVIALTAGEFYGCNNNGDWFSEADLKKYHPSFLTDGNIFLFHQNKDPKQSLGKPIYSVYNDSMHRVELVLEFDKKDPKSKILVDKLKNGEQIYVSMGTKLDHDVCSICNHSSKTRKEYCVHLRYNLKKILPDGRQVVAKNPGPLKFFDISIVNRPADKTAYALQKEASSKDNSEEPPVVSSAELGEQYESTQAKLASLKKISDMIKFVNGDIADADNLDDVTKNHYEFLKNLKKQDIRSIEYPELDFDTMESMDASPGAVIRIIISNGAFPSLGEMAYAAGKTQMGNSFKEDMIPSILNILPKALEILKNHTDSIEPLASGVLNNYNEELESPETSRRLSTIVGPVVTKRIIMIKKAGQEEELIKIAKEMPLGIPSPLDVKRNVNVNRAGVRSLAKGILFRNAEMGQGALDNSSFKDFNGNKYDTNDGNIAVASIQDSTIPAIGHTLSAGLMLAGLLAICSDAPVLQKVLASVGLYGSGLALKHFNYGKTNVEVARDMEIPNNTIFTRSITPLAKLGADATSKLQQLWHTNRPAVLGLTVPSLLGLDYLYNKHVKYRNDPYLEENLSPVGRIAHKMGRVVMDNPVTTLTGSGIAATMLGEMLKRKK